MEVEPLVRTVLSRGRCDSFPELAARYLEEYLQKIQVTVNRLDEEQVWWRPAAGASSVGNLLLHLHGNLSLWILSSLGERDFDRDRAGEFSADRSHRRDELGELLESTVAESCKVVRSIDPADFHRPLSIQGYSCDVLGALFHAVEHMSYHTGQILWIVKRQTIETDPLDLYPRHRGE
ncbi:MAG: DUF1572 domain-containing protein [Acidobacteriota bacterium]|nr:DUF1572 domain-containing protein [Acidobacteriota bacterium]